MGMGFSLMDFFDDLMGVCVREGENGGSEW